MKRGFTLIELLVVIAIIAILAAILFPVFAQAREKARQTTCLSNLKQMGLGILQYVQDHDEFFPMAQYGGGSTNIPQQLWTGMIYPYVKSGRVETHWMDPNQKWYPGIEGIFSCPSYPVPQQNGQYGVHYDVFADFWSCCLPNSQRDARHRVTPIAAIETPAEKVMLVETGVNDASWGWPFFGTWQWMWANSVGNPRGSTDNANIALQYDCDYRPSGNGTWGGCGMLPRYRHNRVANAAFFDGHTKGMARGKILWYKHIYIPVGLPGQWTSEGWYPY